MRVLGVILVLMLVAMVTMMALAQGTDLPPVMLTSTALVQTPASDVYPFDATNQAHWAELTARADTIDKPDAVLTETADSTPSPPGPLSQNGRGEMPDVGAAQVRTQEGVVAATAVPVMRDAGSLPLGPMYRAPTDDVEGDILSIFDLARWFEALLSLLE